MNTDNVEAATVDPLRSPKELCQQGNFSQKTLQRLEVRGEGPPRILITTNCVRYRQSAIDQWLAARTELGARSPGRIPSEALEAKRKRRAVR